MPSILIRRFGTVPYRPEETLAAPFSGRSAFAGAPV